MAETTQVPDVTDRPTSGNGVTVSSSGLSLNLLGAPTLVAGTDPVALSPSATLLCAYLALAPSEGRPRSTVAAQLFVDCSGSVARHRLNTAVWRLKNEVRASVGVQIVAQGTRTLALNQSVDIAVDVALFDDLVSSVVCGRASGMTNHDVWRLEQAVALHRGQLVELCQDDWVLADRYRLENLYLTALDYLVQHFGSCGDIAAVAKYGDLALKVEPLREDIHRHLMAAYGDAGRDDLVERQFERCRMTLLENLGADPMPETIAAYNRMRRGEDSPVVDVQGLVAELERARRDVARLAASVDRALGRLRSLS